MRSGIAMPFSTNFRALADVRIPVQLAPPAPPPKPEDLRDQKSFESYLMQRFEFRTEKVGVAIDKKEALPEIQKFANQAAHAAFEEQRRGDIDKKRDYRVLPLQVRRVIIVRNFDTLTDLLTIAAQESKKITRDIVQRVRDFLCPIYPFCTA